jgi:cysteine desulfurase
MIYLDGASTTPLLPAVRAAMEPFLAGEFGNPSSPHALGRRARKALEDARERAAAALGASPKELVFTSGATESNALAIRGALEALRAKGDHAVTTEVEHPSVLETFARLEREGFRVGRAGVDGGGRVDPARLAALLTARTVLVSVQAVNNETGTIQPIPEIRRAIGRAVLHCDAAQALGKAALDLSGVELLTVSAHKIHGPKGIGVLVARRGTPLAPQLLGGGQEFERRAGTENVAGAVGLAAALEIAVRDLAANAARMERFRGRFRDGLARAGGLREHGPSEGRTPHLLNVSFEGVDAEPLVLALDAEGVCVSSGSACASLAAEPSHVLRAMGLPSEALRGAVRFGLTALTTEAELERAAEIAVGAVARLRRSPAVAR